MTTFTKYLLLFISIYFISCKEKESKKDSWEIMNYKQKEIDTINDRESLNLSQRQNAFVGWDTANMYTYELQEMFNAVGKPISFIGNINDIIKRDSVFILKIYGSNENLNRTYIAEITVDFSKFQEFKQRLTSKRHGQEGCFIFNITEIQTVYPKLSSEVETDGPDVDDASSYLTFNFDETLLQFKGILIDYYLFKEIEDTDE